MYVNRMKLELAMADSGKTPRQLNSICLTTYYKMKAGEEVSPFVVGRLARELGLKAADLVELEDRR